MTIWIIERRAKQKGAKWNAWLCGTVDGSPMFKEEAELEQDALSKTDSSCYYRARKYQPVRGRE